jgi:hypothetical protein
LGCLTLVGLSAKPNNGINQSKFLFRTISGMFMGRSRCSVDSNVNSSN